MLYHNGLVAARIADQEPNKDRYKPQQTMEACNALANKPKAVAWKIVQSTVLCHNGLVAARLADQEPNKDWYKPQQTMEAYNALAN